MAVAVVRDQELLWSRGFGLADVERGIRATPGTRYRVGSVTKLFTATAVMQLRDEGRLDLDDTVKRHLPWFVLAGAGGSPPPDLTIRQLLSHTSGLPREAAFAYWDTLEFPPIALVREGLLRQSTALEPETQWKYSNLAMTLAGEIVAAVSGLPYPRYVERRILEPLGMASTIVDGIAPHDPRLARGYGRRFPHAPRQPREIGDIGGLVPAGNMASTVEDLARFAMLQFRAAPPSEHPVLCGTTLREMHRIHWLEPGWQAGWGLGFRIYREEGRTFMGHGGLVPGHAAEVRILPVEKLAIIVLSNAEDTWPFAYAQRAMLLLLPALAAIAAGKTRGRAGSSPRPLRRTLPERVGGQRGAAGSDGIADHRAHQRRSAGGDGHAGARGSARLPDRVEQRLRLAGRAPHLRAGSGRACQLHESRRASSASHHGVVNPEGGDL